VIAAMVRLWRIVRREPLVHFALAGGLLFGLNAIKANPFAQPRIVVTADTVHRLVNQREQLLGRDVSSAEQRDLITRYIDDEILVQEAYARGLDRQDGAVRQRLLEVMRFIIGEEPPEPTTAELRAFLRQHEAVYRTPRTVSFSHVFLAAEGEGTAMSASNVIGRLRAGADFRMVGDDFWLGPSLDRYPETDLEQLLGREFVRALAAMPLHQWNGPISSTQGVHFVRVDGRFASELPSFEQLQPTLRDDWLTSEREVRLTRKIDPFRRRYRVEIAADDGRK
jgi:hypothetical protein